MKRINWKIILAAFAVLVVSSVFAFVFWAGDISPAADPALQAMQSDSQVFASAENGWVIFFPADEPQPEMGFIFYPGGRVDYRAYAPALRRIAAQGYFVALVPVPLNLAFFDVNAAARVIARYPEVQDWAVGGHSLGGVAASSYAANHPDIKGVVFWASYPANDALKLMDTKALSIYGTNDGLATIATIDESRTLLPADSQFVAIEGGNHAQFASYGLQAGDNEAAISPEEQWTQVANATVEFLEGLK
ncbi:MAG: alpha/beta hydrolase [Chloroflexi bacterium]|nr:alpha/beta hydrolase [Chloroflexota bacterium]